jgi:hypothetical protein
MFFLTGSEMNLSSVPASVSGERWRAYDIQNYDTVVCRVITENGIEILFYASHATEIQVNPTFEFEFEKALIRLDENSNGIVAVHSDGTSIHYGHPDADHQFKKLFKSIEKCRTPSPAICPPEAALSQTLCINSLHELPNEIRTFPARFVVIEKERRWVKGLGEKLLTAYNLWNITNVMQDAKE